MRQRVVVCAANLSIISNKIICGARHWDSIMRGQVEWLKDHPTGRKTPDEWIGCKQGFIDQFGVFMEREEAFQVAKEANQIKFHCSNEGGTTLYSEHLY